MTVVTDANFAEIIKTETPIIIDFWADWCGPCKMIAPIMEELYKEYDSSSLVIAKTNVDENKLGPAKFGIRSIPTLVFLKNGKMIDSIAGAQTKSYIKDKIKENFNI